MLPSGNALLALAKSKRHPGGAAVEVTRAGEVVFEFQGTQSEVNTVQPLEGGNVLLTEAGYGFAGKILMSAWFIPCVGASNPNVCIRAPTSGEARSLHSAWLTADRQPDGTAIAIYDDMWFSSARLPGTDDNA